jgi:hypothetical protein
VVGRLAPLKVRDPGAEQMYLPDAKVFHGDTRM